MPELPSGDVTFLFTDIEGSTRLFHRLGDRYPKVLAEHNDLLGRAINGHSGVIVRIEGDAFFAAFANASDAVMACLEVQRSLIAHPWPPHATVRVRMGLHTGPATPSNGDYVALAVHQAARIAGAAHGGQVLLSEATALLTRASLPKSASFAELGTFLLRGFDTPCSLLSLRHPDLPFAFAQPSAPSTARHNLPSPRTSFVGRDHERGELHRLLAESRLVTVSGPGGVGKTRLATAVAAESISHFPDGVWLVELAPVTSDAAVAIAVARTLGISEQTADDPVTLVCEHLGTGPVLFVLDNCEHVVAGAAAYAEAVMGHREDVRILATSRLPLGAYGETVFKLSPLPVLSGSGSKDDAVQLFAERACLVRPDFTLTSANADHVRSICRRLDGLPLAIELAAARAGAIDPPEIDRQLGKRLDILGRRRTREARHSTITDLVGWSHDLLAAAEQACFRRLGVFAGGFTLESARAVVSGEDLEGDDAVAAVLSLTDHSLVELGEAGQAPYRLLETIRAYAREQLVAAGEWESTRARHRDWYLDLVEDAAVALSGPDQVGWFERLRHEYTNVQAALAHTAESQDQALVARFAASLYEFWTTAGLFREAYEWLEAAAAAHGAHPPHRARALLGLSNVSRALGFTDRAQTAAEEAVALSRDIGADDTLSLALTELANLARDHDELEQASALAGEALALAEKLGDLPAAARAREALAHDYERWGDNERLLSLRHEIAATYRDTGNARGLGRALQDLGVAIGLGGDLRTARKVMEEALEVLHEVGEKPIIAQVLSNLAYLQRMDGDAEAALPVAEESVAVARETGHLRYVAFALNNLAEIALAKEDVDAARAAYVESLGIAVRVGESERIGFCLDGLAALARQSGELRLAVHLVAAAGSFRDSHDVALPSSYQAANESILVDARERLGSDVFAEEWSRGRSLSLEEANALARPT